MKHEMKRKGFTLVELLIVIVVIGILSAMMMLSSTEAVTSARANNIISNLRNLKTAALALYVDKLDNWEGTTAALPKIDDVKGYMGSSGANDYTDYVIAFNDTAKPIADKSWYIVYNFGTGNDVSRVKEKLAGRATSTGLKSLDTKTTDSAKVTPKTLDSKTTLSGVNGVCMQIR